MVGFNIHNVLVVGAIAVIVLFALKKLAGTKLRNIPVVGQALSVAAAA